jgi:hypothetical protein
VSGTYWYQWSNDVTGNWGLVQPGGAHKLAYDEFVLRNASSTAPVKLLEYDLGGPHTIDEIRIFTGNGDADGRIFSTTVISTSADGVNFDLLGYFQSDPSGQLSADDRITMVRIFQNEEALTEGVTHMRFDLYAASNLNGVMLDPYSGTNAFTGLDDGLTRAYVSPKVWEIDVLGSAEALIPGDFDGDGNVDSDDLAIWQSHFGQAGSSNGDADGDQDADGADFLRWQMNHGYPAAFAASANVPEPTSHALVWLVVMGLTLSTWRCMPIVQ